MARQKYPKSFNKKEAKNKANQGYDSHGEYVYNMPNRSRRKDIQGMFETIWWFIRWFLFGFFYIPYRFFAWIQGKEVKERKKINYGKWWKNARWKTFTGFLLAVIFLGFFISLSGSVLGQVSWSSLTGQQECSPVGLAVNEFASTQFSFGSPSIYIDGDGALSDYTSYSTWDKSYIAMGHFIHSTSSWDIDVDPELFQKPDISFSKQGLPYPVTSSGVILSDYAYEHHNIEIVDENSTYDYTYYVSNYRQQIKVAVSGDYDIDEFKLAILPGKRFIGVTSLAETPAMFNPMDDTGDLVGQFFGQTISFKTVFRFDVRSLGIADVIPLGADYTANTFFGAYLSNVDLMIDGDTGWLHDTVVEMDRNTRGLEMYASCYDALLGLDTISSTGTVLTLGDLMYDTVYIPFDFTVTLGSDWKLLTNIFRPGEETAAVYSEDSGETIYWKLGSMSALMDIDFTVGLSYANLIDGDGSALTNTIPYQTETDDDGNWWNSIVMFFKNLWNGDGTRWIVWVVVAVVILAIIWFLVLPIVTKGKTGGQIGGGKLAENLGFKSLSGQGITIMVAGRDLMDKVSHPSKVKEVKKDGLLKRLFKPKKKGYKKKKKKRKSRR